MCNEMINRIIKYYMKKDVYIFSLHSGILKLNGREKEIKNDGPPVRIKMDSQEDLLFTFTPFSTTSIQAEFTTKIEKLKSKCDYLKIFHIDMNRVAFLVLPTFINESALLKNDNSIYSTHLKTEDGKYELFKKYDSCVKENISGIDVYFLDEKRMIIKNGEKILADEWHVIDIENETDFAAICDYADLRGRMKMIRIENGEIKNAVVSAGSDSIDEKSYEPAELTFLKSALLGHFSDCQNYLSDDLISDLKKDDLLAFFSLQLIFPIYLDEDVFILSGSGHYHFEKVNNKIINIHFTPIS